MKSAIYTYHFRRYLTRVEAVLRLLMARIAIVQPHNRQRFCYYFFSPFSIKAIISRRSSTESFSSLTSDETTLR